MAFPEEFGRQRSQQDPVYHRGCGTAGQTVVGLGAAGSDPGIQQFNHHLGQFRQHPAHPTDQFRRHQRHSDAEDQKSHLGQCGSLQRNFLSGKFILLFKYITLTLSGWIDPLEISTRFAAGTFWNQRQSRRRPIDSTSRDSPTIFFLFKRNNYLQLRSLRHENVNMMMGCFCHETNPALLFEYCSRGSLNEILRRQDLSLDWTFQLSLLTDLVRVCDRFKNELI